MATHDRVTLDGSTRTPMAGARRVAGADPDERITVTVQVRRRTGGGPAPALGAVGGDRAARIRQREQLAEMHGADPADLDKVAAFASAHGLEVGERSAARRAVELSGTVGQMQQAFGVDLGRYEGPGVAYRGREGDITLPAELAGIVEGVFGLDDRPQAVPHFKIGEPIPDSDLTDHLADPLAAAAVKAKPLWPAQVAKLYDFPIGVDGSGETIAIIELGGGYHDSELATYFKKAKIAKPPTVVAVGVDGGSNSPGAPADGEVLLDIEVAGCVASGAEIVVYFAPNTIRGFLDAITTAVHSTDHPATCVSISWGAPESGWTGQAMHAFDGAFADANALGVTVLCAAGDHGAADGGGDGKVHADFPASSPHAVACGGTTLVGQGGHTVSEVVWNDSDGWATGGGISQVFPVPAYQAHVTLPAALSHGHAGRGVPDVAANADITTGYICLVNGKLVPIGGTSAVAPLYAGLTALLAQGLGHPVGDLTAALYGLASGHNGSTCFRDITQGDNSVPTSQFGPATTGYKAGTGWDACTGLGSLHGAELLAALKSSLS